VLLHFGAVDYLCQAWVNGKRVGEHTGGYLPFTFDITESLAAGENELVVSVWDPTDAGLQQRGKQVLRPKGIWYTAVSGIWQTVWLEAVGQAARAIRLREAELVLAGGVESMSRSPYVLAKAGGPFARDQKLEDTTLGWRFVNPAMEARHGIDSMTQTAENLAREHGIERADQDAYARRSQERAERARARGWLAEEIVPVPVKAGKQTRVVDRDEHPRPETTLDDLARLKPLLGPGTTITAGNASGLNDGAGALLLASEAAAARLGLEPLARVGGMSSAGVPPRTMGLGPVPAIRKLLAREGRTLGDYDVVEIGEAFAAQVLACTRALGLPDDADFVNPNGGAIALGHPLGASGARLCTTAILEMRRRGARRALVSLCVGVGQGLALGLERVS